MWILRSVRVAVTPRRALLKTTLANGLVVYGRNRAGHGGRGIYVYRDSIEPEFAHLDQLLPGTGVFVDVGASVGIYALKAAMHFAGSGAVLALEPFPEVFDVLRHNIETNRLRNVRALRLCAGAQAGARTLWLNRERPSSYSIAHRVGDARGLAVQTVALDDLLPQEGLDRLDYLKIDAEGAEEEILEGARRTIERCRPIIQTEISIRRFLPALPAYSTFQAPGSGNLLHLPEEHPRIGVPGRLGWRPVKTAPAA